MTRYTDGLVPARLVQAGRDGAHAFPRPADHVLDRLTATFAQLDSDKPTAVPAAAVEQADPWQVIVERWIAVQTSDRTREGYTREARLYTGWCEQRGLDPRAVRRHDVEAYRNARTVSGDSARTLARRLSALSSLYTYAGGYGIGSNPVSGVKRPKIDRSSSPSQSLARPEVPRLLAVAQEDGPRSAALVALLVLNGLRVSEALGDDVADLGHDHGHRTLTIRGKGGAQTKVPLAPLVARAVDACPGRILGRRV